MTQSELVQTITALKATVDTFPALIASKGQVTPELEQAVNDLSASVSNASAALAS